VKRLKKTKKDEYPKLTLQKEEIDFLWRYLDDSPHHQGLVQECIYKYLDGDKYIKGNRYKNFSDFTYEKERIIKRELDKIKEEFAKLGILDVFEWQEQCKSPDFQGLHRELEILGKSGIVAILDIFDRKEFSWSMSGYPNLITVDILYDEWIEVKKCISVLERNVDVSVFNEAVQLYVDWGNDNGSNFNEFLHDILYYGLD
jgi:transposase InsO family protein